MERAANLKLYFLLALLVIGSCLNEGIKAQRQCETPSDCVERCHGCLVNQCTAGLCVCGCATSIKQEKPVQCERPSDCIERCHGCTVNQCTAGLCVCGCNALGLGDEYSSIKQEKPVQCEKPDDCVDLCHGCTANKCTAGLCVCGC